MTKDRRSLIQWVMPVPSAHLCVINEKCKVVERCPVGVIFAGGSFPEADLAGLKRFDCQAYRGWIDLSNIHPDFAQKDPS